MKRSACYSTLQLTGAINYTLVTVANALNNPSRKYIRASSRSIKVLQHVIYTVYYTPGSGLNRTHRDLGSSRMPRHVLTIIFARLYFSSLSFSILHIALETRYDYTNFCILEPSLLRDATEMAIDKSLIISFLLKQVCEEKKRCEIFFSYDQRS